MAESEKTEEEEKTEEDLPAWVNTEPGGNFTSTSINNPHDASTKTDDTATQEDESKKP